MTIKVFSMIFISVIYLFVAWVHHQTAHDNWQVAHGTKANDEMSDETFATLKRRALRLYYLSRIAAAAAICLTISYNTWVIVGLSFWLAGIVSAMSLIVFLVCSVLFGRTKPVTWSSSISYTGTTYYVFADR